MILLSKKHLTLAEVKELATKLEDSNPLSDYLKAFSSLSVEKAKKLEEELRQLDNLKIREEDIVKIIDFLPGTQEEVNKVFTEVSLTEEEANKILEIVKNY